MVCLRKRLYHSMIRNSNGRMAPLIRTLYQYTGIRHTVHITHLGMAMQFYALFRIIVQTRGSEICYFFNTGKRTNGNLMVELVNGRHTFQFEESSFFHSSADFSHLFIMQEYLYGNRICKIRNIKHINGFFIADFPGFNRCNLTADRHFTHLTGNCIYRNRIIIKIPSINHIRIIRTAKRTRTLVIAKSSLSEVASLTKGRVLLPVLWRRYRFFLFFLRCRFLFFLFYFRLCHCQNRLSSGGLSYPGMKENLLRLFHNPKFTVAPHFTFHRFFVICMHFQIKSASFTENLFQNTDQFRLTLPGNGRVCHHQVHRLRFRETDLGRRKHIEFQHTIMFQFQQNTWLVYIQKIFRRILSGQNKLFNYLHLKRSPGKELLPYGLL